MYVSKIKKFLNSSKSNLFDAIKAKFAPFCMVVFCSLQNQFYRFMNLPAD